MVVIKVTLVCTVGHHVIPENEEADKFAKEGTNLVPSLPKMLASVLLCCKKVIRTHLVQVHLNRWKASNGCRQSQTLLSELLSSGTEELKDRLKRR